MLLLQCGRDGITSVLPLCGQTVHTLRVFDPLARPYMPFCPSTRLHTLQPFPNMSEEGWEYKGTTTYHGKNADKWVRSFKQQVRVDWAASQGT